MLVVSHFKIMSGSMVLLKKYPKIFFYKRLLSGENYPNYEGFIDVTGMLNLWYNEIDKP